MKNKLIQKLSFAAFVVEDNAVEITEQKIVNWYVYINWVLYALFIACIACIIYGSVKSKTSDKINRKKRVIKYIGIILLILLPFIWMMNNFVTSAP